MYTHKLLLKSSIILLSIAILVAYLNPATAYETSIYTGTPLLYWVLVSSAVIAALLGSLASNKWYRITGIVVVAISTLTIISLPVLRGYWMLGAGDSLSHLGRIHTLKESQQVIDFFYPGFYLLSIFLEEVGGIPTRTSLLVLAPTFTAIFIPMIGLMTRLILRIPRVNAFYTGIFVGTLVLPINLVATHLKPHPNSLTILFAALGLHLLLRIIIHWSRRILAMFVLSTAATIIYHPQQALNVFSVIVIISAVYHLTNKGFARDVLLNPVFVGACIIGLLWSMWTLSFERFKTAFAAVLIQVIQFQNIDATAGRGGTLSQLGSGLLDISLRLFLLDIVMILFSLLAVYISFSYYFREKTADSVFSRYTQSGKRINHNLVVFLTLSLVPIAMFVGVFLVAGVTQQFMRYVGFGMLITSVLAAAGLVEFCSSLPRPSRKWVTNAVVLVAISGLLIISVAVYFPSPFIYQGSSHVTEASVTGYESLFEYHSDGVEMMSINGIIWRYAVGLEGTQGNPMTEYTAFRGLAPPNHMANQTLHSHYRNDRVLVSTENMRYREADLYNGIHFSIRDFEYLNHQPGIDRVYDNGDAEAYFIHERS
jgi:hypothetical protein